MKPRILLILILVLASAAGVLAQNEEVEVSKISGVPKDVMQDVIRRVLIYKFKPVSRQKRVILAKQIYFAEPGSSRFEITIDEGWLPTIKNVDFELQTGPFDNDVYFFKESESKLNVHEILFAFGDPTCSYLGDSWKFRVSGNRSRLWQDGGGGGGCSGSSHSPSLGWNQQLK